MKNWLVTSISAIALYGCTAFALPGGDENGVEIAKGSHGTTFDTIKPAMAHCKKYGKIAKLEREAGLFTFPYRDTYICIKP